MEIPITNPHLSANLEDNSKVDDSFNQQGTTVNLGSGATYNQNCGNQREMSRMTSTLLGMGWSLLFDVVIIVSMLWGFDKISTRFSEKLENFNKQEQVAHEKSGREYKELVEKSDKTHKEMMKQAKEGTIWLLRDDIIKTIDFHEATKKITQKQYKRLKEEFQYYTSIGGNHDVKERFEDFMSEIFGTQEIKMVTFDVASDVGNTANAKNMAKVKR